MNVLVMASTIKMGGAKTIYNQFMSHLPEHIGSDKYLIYVSEMLEKPEITNVEYVVNHITNGLKLLRYERKYLANDLEQRGFKPDLIISLQNNGYKYIKNCKQIVYYHQALPLYEGIYNPFNSTERILFYYKNVYPYVMKSTWAKDTIFAVQTPVVKKRFSKTFGVPQERINIFFPDTEQIDASSVKPYDWGDENYHFLFVGDGFKYRNQLSLIKAIRVLYQKNASLAERVRIHVLSPKEHNSTIIPTIENLGLKDNFVFVGRVDYHILLSYYKSAQALLLSSVIETVGLPLLEAAAFGIPVITSDMDFAQFVISAYRGASFIEPYDEVAWSTAIEDASLNRKHFMPFIQNQMSEWHHFFELVSENLSKES